MHYDVPKMINKILSIFSRRPTPQNIKILVIEDTQVDQRLACAAIESGGYTSLKANDGKTGLAIAKEQHPAMIILDYNLPDITGPDVCKYLKEHAYTKNIPVLFLTSMTNPDHVVNCYDQGQNYLEKPVSTKLLLKQIKSILSDNTPKD